MMNKDTGMVTGDNIPMTDKGASKAGNYDKSLGDASKSDLDNGYHSRSDISKEINKQEGGFA